MTKAKVIADSLGSSRLTTFEIEFPRFLQAELNTHKMLAKNSASSRAIPVEKQLERVRENPFRPAWWGENQPGMVAGGTIPTVDVAYSAWDNACMHARLAACDLSQLNVHKQYANRLLEPFMYQKVIITGDAPSWANFFNLRCSEFAQPEFDELAGLMLRAYVESTPHVLEPGDWHVPYGVEWGSFTVGYDPPRLLGGMARSVAACARVSYRSERDTSLGEDEHLCSRLVSGGHWSPFEHQAQYIQGTSMNVDGPWKGWRQLRKFFPNENRTELDTAALLTSWEQRRADRGL